MHDRPGRICPAGMARRDRSRRSTPKPSRPRKSVTSGHNAFRSRNREEFALSRCDGIAVTSRRGVSPLLRRATHSSLVPAEVSDPPIPRPHLLHVLLRPSQPTRRPSAGARALASTTTPRSADSAARAAPTSRASRSTHARRGARGARIYSNQSPRPARRELRRSLLTAAPRCETSRTSGVRGFQVPSQRGVVQQHAKRSGARCASRRVVFDVCVPIDMPRPSWDRDATDRSCDRCKQEPQNAHSRD